MHNNPWKSYRKIATQTAPPGQLVLMLYDGAIRFLERGLTGFADGDPAESNMTVHNNFQRASDIIRELNLCLNMQEGGETAGTLRRLYDYFDRRILESDMRKQPEGAREVIRHLTVLRDAWASMLNGQNGAVLAGATETQVAALNMAVA